MDQNDVDMWIGNTSVYSQSEGWEQFPFASAYIMGFYDSDMKLPELIWSRDDAGLRWLRKLETLIERYHPGWKLDEMYYHGTDLAWEFAEASVTEAAAGDLSPEDAQEILRGVIGRARHNKFVVMATHAIGEWLLVASREL